MKTGYKVCQVMTQKVLCTGPGTTIRECAKLMTDNRVGSIVVCDGDKAVGILTEQDLARKVLAKDLDADNTKVSQIMSTSLYSVETDVDLYDAMLYMGNQKIKHLPVIEEGKLKGLISFKDVIRLQPDLAELAEFKSSMNKEEMEILFSKR